MVESNVRWSCKGCSEGSLVRPTATHWSTAVRATLLLWLMLLRHCEIVCNALASPTATIPPHQVTSTKYAATIRTAVHMLQSADLFAITRETPARHTRHQRGTRRAGDSHLAVDDSDPLALEAARVQVEAGQGVVLAEWLVHPEQVTGSARRANRG